MTFVSILEETVACNFVLFKCMVRFTDVAMWSKMFIGKFLTINSISYYRSVESLLLPNSVKSTAIVWMLSVSKGLITSVALWGGSGTF